MSYLLTVAVLETYHTIYFRARGYDFLWPFVHDFCRPPITHKLWWSFCVLIWIPLGCGILKSPLFSFVFLRDTCFFVTSHRVCPMSDEVDVETRNAVSISANPLALA